VTGARNTLYTLLVPLTVLLWGTEYTLIAYIVDYIPPIWMVSIRTVIAALILVTVALFQGHKLPAFNEKSWLWYGTMGVVGMTLPFYLIAAGEVHIDSGLTAILMGVTPLITVVLAHFFIRSEPLTPLKSSGFLIGFVGIVLLFMPEEMGLKLIKNWQAQAVILIAAFGYAATSIIGKRAPAQPAIVGGAIMLIAAALTSTIGALLSGPFEPVTTFEPLLALAILTLGATALGNFLYLRILQLSGPSLIAKINYMVPVFSIIAGMMFLNEPFNPRAILALAIIVVGLIIARKGEAS
jgi:drug/metabolite transporter (DMT)-like permease